MALLSALARCATTGAVDATESVGVPDARAAATTRGEARGATTSSDAVLGVMVRALSAEVEAIRGRRFLRAVRYRVLSTEAIAAHFRAQAEGESAAQRGDDLLAVALGHLRDENQEDRDAFAAMMGAEAQGFYDPREAVLTLSEVEARALTRPGPAGMDARATVVHELVHALQDQHFHERVAVDERAAAMTDAASVRLALLEGDATLVTLEWQARQRGGRLLGTSDQRLRIARWAERAQVLTEANVPKYVLDAMELPYEAGAFAVGALYERGGWAAVDAALARMDLRSGAMLHPERGDEGLVTVAAPALIEGAERVLERELGELELRLLLATVLRKERASELASAWRGDRVALDRARDDDGSLIVQWLIVTDGEEGARMLERALRPLVDRWRREGCPRMRDSSATRCEASITAEGNALVLRRGTRR